LSNGHQVFEALGEKVKKKPCLAMQGLIAEGEEAIKGDDEPESRIDSPSARPPVSHGCTDARSERPDRRIDRSQRRDDDVTYSEEINN
jgi:Domain of unknown function (DUF892)